MILNLISDCIVLTDIPQILPLGAVLAAFYFMLFIMRMMGVLKKRKCPSCSGKLTRKPRIIFDKMLALLTLNILPFRRYRCIHCGWEGLRWSGRKQRKSDSYG